MKRPFVKLIVIIALIVCLVGVSFYVLMFGKKGVKESPEPVSDVQVQGVGKKDGKAPISGTGTLADLKNRSEDLECQVIYERSAVEGPIEGTVFVSRNNMRADFLVPAPEYGGKILSSMIVGGESMYVWSTINDSTFGFKTAASGEGTDQIDTKEPVPLTASVRYTCTDWTELDGSVFVPPAKVEFKDIAPIIKAGPEDGTIKGEF